MIVPQPVYDVADGSSTSTTYDTPLPASTTGVPLPGFRSPSRSRSPSPSLEADDRSGSARRRRATEDEDGHYEELAGLHARGGGRGTRSGESRGFSGSSDNRSSRDGSSSSGGTSPCAEHAALRMSAFGIANANDPHAHDVRGSSRRSNRQQGGSLGRHEASDGSEQGTQGELRTEHRAGGVVMPRTSRSNSGYGLGGYESSIGTSSPTERRRAATFASRLSQSTSSQL